MRISGTASSKVWRSREPALDILDVKSAGLRGTKDPALLEIAAEQGRILITQDRNTMTSYFWERLAAGKSSPGLFVVPDRPGAHWRRNRVAPSRMDGIPVGRVASPDCLRTHLLTPVLNNPADVRERLLPLLPTSRHGVAFRHAAQ